MSPLLPALVALFIGSSGVPISFKGLMTQVPKYNAIWAVIHPIHGLMLYTIVLSVVRPSPKRRSFRAMYALPMSMLFGLYNVMKSSCGKGSAVPGIIVHLTDQLEPLVVMLLTVALGRRGGFPAMQWAAAALLLASSFWYILNDTTTALDIKSNYQLGLCLAKNVPLASAFMYIEWVLMACFPDVFPTVLWWWVCVFQMFTTLVPAYVQFTPGEVGGLGYFSFLSKGIMCYWLGGPEPECQGMPARNAVGILFGGMMNLAMPVVARHGGAPVLMMVRAVTLPVVAILFTSSFLAGDEAAVPDLQKALGLVCATAALLMWSAAAREQRAHAE